ncbi:FecCD family ABC transporter permease [Amphibacillus cookii]|uniref:FecCD family ABC transporter permease n=1 Tax=Amphibacillus cookii TaxID=767787 RepID=UPI00195CDF1B|nr:iron ABC transporter permease [Amphibacillus cookii]MBM7541966.1 iron complex transport system permease protein [Amphibacillus cookii]
MNANKNNIQIANRTAVGSTTLIVGIILLILSMTFSIIHGAVDIELSTIWESLTQFNPDLTTHQIIYELRLPRVLAAALVGAFLAISGVIMQGITQNPLASPSIMGVSAGAAFMIAIAFAFFSTISQMGLMIWAFIGAGFGAGLVFLIGQLSKTGLSPVKLALAGTAISTFLQSLSTALAIHFDVARDISFWFAGGIAGTRWISIQIMIPVALIGISLALFISRSLTMLSFGEELAIGLGQRTKLVKTTAIIVVLLLTGSAVAVAGTIGFIGLVIPHITRFLVGLDYRWIIPCSAILGALLLVLADLGARMINPPFETPVGAITALVGVPFFLFLARSDRRGL